MNNTSVFFNMSMNITGNNLFTDICGPFKMVASFDYNGFIIVNLVVVLFMLLDKLYYIQRDKMELKPERIERNNKIILLSFGLYNSIFAANHFLLIPLVDFFKAVYGI